MKQLTAQRRLWPLTTTCSPALPILDFNLALGLLPSSTVKSTPSLTLPHIRLVEIHPKALEC